MTELMPNPDGSFRRVTTEVPGDAWREEVRPPMTGGMAANVWVVIP